jgi:3-O-methylgallate 3,4-dioxygenase
MAKVVGVYNTVHTPFCFMPPSIWNEVRANRSLREDVPFDDDETNVHKHQRIQDAFAILKKHIYDQSPDVILVYGDDQLESFDFTNFPAFAVYVGEEFEGPLPSRDTTMAGGMPVKPGEVRKPPVRVNMKAHSELGVGLLTGLMERGFDPAFSVDLPKPERGMGHAFMRPAGAFFDLETPLLPVFINCYFAPQPTAARCYEFGKAVRESIETLPGDARVAILGSGGLWHTPGAKDAYLDEDFDQSVLSHLAAGDIKGMADAFDDYRIPEGDRSQYIGERARQATGMPGFGGPQGGTREICNWVASSAAADGNKSTIVDYIPVYASPVGAGFSYCDNPS